MPPPGYLSADGLEGVVTTLSSLYPGFTRLIRLDNRSAELHREIHALRIGTRDDAHGVLILGGVHAREIVNPDLLATFATQLCDAYQRRVGLSFGPVSYSATFVRILVEGLSIFVLPLVNPDGRIHVQTPIASGGWPMWRKNRGRNPGSPCLGVDVNRNADFLWSSGIGTSTDPCPPDYPPDTGDGVYRGDRVFSEPETQNVRWLLDEFPNIKCVMDIHSYSECFLYPWGVAPNQSADSTMNFLNPAWDGTRHDDTTYREYIPSADLGHYERTATSVRDAIAAVRGTAYKTSQIWHFIDAYRTTATITEYAYARHFINPSKPNVWGYSLETGTEFQPVYAVAQEWMTEVSNGLVRLLARCLCPLEEILRRLFGTDSEAMAHALRGFRDKRLLDSPLGTRWVELLEEHGLEVIAIVEEDPRFGEDLRELVAQAVQLVVADEAARRPRVPSDLVKAAERLARRAARKATPQLRSALREVEASLLHFDGATISRGLAAAEAAAGVTKRKRR